MLTITVDLGKFNQQLDERLADVLSKIDVQNILDEAGAALLNRQRDRFLRQVDPDETPWWPSQASKDREKSGRDGGTLFDTGTLFHSIQLHAAGSNEREISTDVPYAKFAQFGTSQPHSLRPFLGFNGEDQTVFEKIVQSHLKDV